jgi:preprotein translocase subunit SecA
MFNYIAKKIFGSVNDRAVKSFYGQVDRINALESQIMALSDSELRAKTDEFKARLNNGQSLDDILCEAFAVVREASKRVLNMRHFDVQLIGGMVLHSGRIAEMKTGEGKTLVSSLPCYLNALQGKGVHIVTVNDYLAKRDAKWMGNIHQFLGLSVGCVTGDMNDQQRKQAYNCDITYATNNELGFDYLRDNMKYSLDEILQRRNFAIVDEVDSILVDEARTPLIISGPTDDNSLIYEQINRLIPKLAEKDFQIEEKERSVFLTEEGTETMEKLLKSANLIGSESSLYDLSHVSLVHHINQALKAHKIFRSEIDYIVKDGAVVIIDEFTGRMQEGRRFSDGLHQALEAKELVKVKNENQTLASITFQNYFRLYNKLSGMTGTAMTEAVEFEEIYNLKVVEIPTNQIVSRIDEDDEIYKTEAAKFDAIVKVIEDCYQRQQPILVGTVSIEKSEHLSKLLKKHKLPHNILNAKYHDQEAEIIAQAGVPKAITIATNMAGRGTDIMLGGNPEMLIQKAKEEITDELELSKMIAKIKEKTKQDKETAIAAGGLYVLGTERHESRRIDNQLRGRSGRQGDPGRSKFFLSLEDDLMRIFGSEKLQKMLSTLGLKDDEAIFHPWITKTLYKAQHKVEMRNYEIRKNLIKYDDVINQQRKIIFNLRNQIINLEGLSEKIQKFKADINSDIVADYIPKNSYPEQWNIDGISEEIRRIYGIKLDIKSKSEEENIAENEILEFINLKTDEVIAAKKSQFDKIGGDSNFAEVQKQIFLITLDSEWKDHLLSLDKLRHGINLRAYAQKDPLIEYKKDAFNLFEEMLLRIEEQVVARLSHVHFNLESQNSAEINLVKNIKPQKTFQTRLDPSFADSEERSLNNQRNANPKVTGSFAPIVKNKISPKDRNPLDPNSWGNIGRNEPCPCGSGAKYKHCHGKS